MIHVLSYIPDEKVLGEINAIEETRNALQKRVDDCKTVEDYCHSFLSSSSGHEFLTKVPFNRPGKVLDIGFGKGETSLYLASRGLEVHAIEPSPLNCEILQKASVKYGQKIHIYQGTAEHFDQIDESHFDLCLFNSSLHHCDYPVKVLEICRTKLKKGGRVIAINEPILKFFRSKKWFYKKLETDPVSMGHYGGNEHIYYCREYLDLFKKAGFTSADNSLHVKNINPRLALEEDLKRKTDGQYVCSDRKLLIKFSILFMLKGLWRKPFTSLVKKISLFSHSFEATV